MLTTTELVDALESYSSHLEPTFVQVALPPCGPNQSIPPTFDLSPSYVDRLDAEFTRVYEEYTRRIATVQTLSNHIIQLWAELGIPQAQQDGAIVKNYRDTPEQLGLHEEDIARLQSKRDRLADEKKNRERKLRDLKAAVEALWAKLGVDGSETKVFLNQNRGCGVRQINEFEDELARLNELKRQNLHLFVEDADKQFEQALSAGAEMVMPLGDQFWGDRYGIVKDPSGHQWSIGSHMEDLTSEQMQERMMKAFCQSEPVER